MSTREECLRAEGAINALDVTGVRIGELETENLNLRLLADSAAIPWRGTARKLGCSRKTKPMFLLLTT